MPEVFATAIYRNTYQIINSYTMFSCRFSGNQVLREILQGSWKMGLQGPHHKWFLSAQPNGTAECNRERLQGWETISVEFEGDRWIYLKSWHGKYLSAQPNGQLQWNRDKKLSWERFKVIYLGGNRIALKSSHGKYVSAQPDGRIEVNRRDLKPWEKFQVVKVY